MFLHTNCTFDYPASLLARSTSSGSPDRRKGCTSCGGLSSDDLVDQLIANNAARPIPGMEKPDPSKFALRLGEQQHGPTKRKRRARKRRPSIVTEPDHLLIRERLRINVIEASEV